METIIYRFPGDLTVLEAGETKKCIVDLLARGPCILALDMSNVNYMDSAGLGVLTAAAFRAREKGGEVLLHRPQPRVYAVLRTTRLDKVFEILDTPPGEAPAEA